MLIIITTEDLVGQAGRFWAPGSKLLTKLNVREPHQIQIEPSCHPVEILVRDLHVEKLEVGKGAELRLTTANISEADCRGPVEAVEILGSGHLRFKAGGAVEEVKADRGQRCVIHGPEKGSGQVFVLRNRVGPGVSVDPGTEVKVNSEMPRIRRPVSDFRPTPPNQDREAELRGRQTPAVRRKSIF